MKRVLFIFALLGLTATIAFGQVIREERQVSEFRGITVSGVFNVTVLRGDVHSLVIETDAAVMPYAYSMVTGDWLVLAPFEGIENQHITTLNATIVTPNLESVLLSGASRVVVEDLFTPDRFVFVGGGSNSLVVKNVNTNQLRVQISGSSNVEINANVSEKAEFYVGGVGNISGNLVAERVCFRFGGVGNVTLTGSAMYGTINASGVPTMNLIDFPIREVTVNAPGAGNITVNATHSLEINAYGVSTIRYTGSATVQRNVGRLSNVSRL